MLKIWNLSLNVLTVATVAIFTVSGARAESTTELTVESAEEMQGATFNWYTCVLFTSPFDSYRGRGKKLDLAKQDAVDRCNSGDEEEGVCEGKLEAGEFACSLNPGWDW